ncbi:hypothetical protein ABBQ38_011770 [Trebouxia sp. C0009 RCD-2024]
MPSEMKQDHTGKGTFATVIGANMAAMLDYELLPAFMQHRRWVTLTLQFRKRATCFISAGILQDIEPDEDDNAT